MTSQTQLIAKYGYRQETHHVTTDDGYILELHRIATTGGQPVIFMHGVLDSSATWVISGPKIGLGETNNPTFQCSLNISCISIRRVYSIGLGLRHMASKCSRKRLFETP